MNFRSAIALVLVTLTAACSPKGPSNVLREATSDTDDSEPFHPLSPLERVPPFRISSTEGKRFDSRALVGNRAFVIVFFASWCGVCELKFPSIHRALAQNDHAVPVIAVSADDERTLDALPAFLERNQVSYPVVIGARFPRFALAYDPFRIVPAIAVIGRNGYLVDYQLGFRAGHEARLTQAITTARQIPRDAPPYLARSTPGTLDEQERPR